MTTKQELHSLVEDLPEIANWSWTADFSDPAGPPPLAVGQPRAALFTDS